MGAVGNIVAGSELEELWSTVYAKASVVYMITGRVYARALRAHFLTQEALSTMLLQKADSFSQKNKDQLYSYYDYLINRCTSAEDVLTADVVSNLNQDLKNMCQVAIVRSRTAKL